MFGTVRKIISLTVTTTKVKICGLTTYEDAKAALDLGADALGFNFVPSSPRFLSVSAAQAIVRRLSPQAWFVGVFADAEKETIVKTARQVGLDTLQFHGNETPEFCQEFKEWRVIKAHRLRETHKVSDVNPFLKVADIQLYDAYSERALGGTGQRIESDILEKLNLEGLLTAGIIAGGLTAQNVGELVRKYRPFAVDVAGGVESQPGKKSEQLMKEFILAAKGAGN